MANKLNASTFQSVSGDYINADLVLSGNLKTYVDNQVINKLDKSVFANISGEYKTADENVSSLIMTEVNKKAEIKYGDLPQETASGILYINDVGIISTVINNNVKAISHELVSDIFANIENDEVIPTTQAVATYVDTKIAGIDIEGATGISINVINNLVSGKVDNNKIISGDITEANDVKIPTTQAVSTFVDTKIKDADIALSSLLSTYVNEQVASKLDITAFENLSGEYKNADIALSGLLSTYINEQITPKLNITTFESLSGEYKNADIALSGLLSTYVDSQVAPKLDITTFESLSGEYKNADIALSGVLSTYVDTQVANKLDITTFKSLSGEYKNADIALSGLLSTYVDSQVVPKLDITTFESLSGEYKDADIALSGLLSTYVDKQVSGKLAKSTFKNVSGEYKNADIALSGLLMDEINKKQDILTFATTEISTVSESIIPTTQAVSTFVESKIGNIDKDYFIQGAEYDSTTSSIILTYNADKSPLTIPVSDLIDIYTAGDGLNLNNNEFSIKTNSAEDNKFIALDSNGFGLSGITTAITSYIEETTKLVELTDTVTATTYDLNYETAQLFNLTLNTTSLTLTASNIPKNETILVYLTTTGCSIIYNSNEILSSIDEGTYILFLGNFSGTIQLIGNPILCS